MITCCNQCGTKFEISAELVQSEDPSVRCGECLSVFDACAQLVGGDSARNYGHVSASRQIGKRHAQQVVHTANAGRAVESARTIESAEVPAVPERQYAHISDVDLEHADTVVLDGKAPHSPNNSTVPGRVNDGFYSPDLTASPVTARRPEIARHTDERTVAAKRKEKLDPSIDIGDSLDSTSLEFERTLALENYADIDAQRNLTDHHAAMADDLSPMEAPVVPTQLAPDVQSYSAEKNDSDEIRTRAVERQSAEPLLDSGQSVLAVDSRRTSRDYPRIDNRFSVEDPDALESLSDTVDPDRHLAPEDLDSLSNRKPEPAFSDDTLHERVDKHDSARDLRRYVESRGGVIVPGNDQGLRQKRKQSQSMAKPLLFVALLAAGGLYLGRDAIATMNLPEPVLSVFCSVTGCELPLQKDVGQLELVRHNMASHASLDNVLVFTVDLINRANFPQPYPALVVTMANKEGASVAFRKFQPEEYLEEAPELKKLPAGKPVRIKFEIVDPGPQAMSSELSFE